MNYRNRIQRILLVLLFLLCIWQNIGLAESRQEYNPQTFIKHLRLHLREITSDKDALAIYSSHFAPQVGLSDTLPLLKPFSPGRWSGRPITPPQLSEPAVTLIKSLAVWETADALPGLLPGNPQAPEEEWADFLTEPESWLLTHSTGALFSKARGLIQTLNAFAPPPHPESLPEDEYRRFSLFLDQEHPDLFRTEDSWVALAARSDTTTLRQRFQQFWKRHPHSTLEEHTAIARYISERLSPVFSATITALSIEIKTKAEQQGLGAWKKLTGWKEVWSRKNGLARLCGEWKWVIHNHQNHSDHKTMMTFPSPDKWDKVAIKPSYISILGDTVYLRWEFPGGFQEDSLLFSKKDDRLEGSFRHSAGARGTITGNRLGTCQWDQGTEKGTQQPPPKK